MENSMETAWKRRRLGGLRARSLTSPRLSLSLLGPSDLDHRRGRGVLGHLGS